MPTLSQRTTICTPRPLRLCGAFAVFLHAFCLPLVAGCAGPAATPEGGEVTVFAASSLKDAFESMAGDLKKEGISKADYNFAGSQALATQLEQGAKADVFASADARSMEAAIASGAVASGTQRVLATNKLVFIVPPGQSGKVTDLNDLVKPGLKLVLADPSVPAGNYSLQLLERLSADSAYGGDFKERVLANVASRESNVRQVVAKVQLGEADVGIVYATDAKSTSGSSPVGMIEIPDAYNIVARYYIAPVLEAPHPEEAQRFVEYVLSDKGQQLMGSYGFGRAGGDE